MSNIVETDVLVVGAGPAGGATAMFLAQYGVKAITISRSNGVADTPRAHIVNQRAMEVLRDAGLEERCLDAAAEGETQSHTFWLRSIAGEELARAWTWGNDPARQADVQTASPCRTVDLPQDLMEPILLNEATRLGGTVRFDYELQSFKQDENGVTAEVVDLLAGNPVTIRARYMVGADGARSKVVEQLDLPLVGQQRVGSFFNVLCDVDLSQFVQHRHGSLYQVIQPGSPYSMFAVYRMVRPWTRWLIGFGVPPQMTDMPSKEDFVGRIRQTIGRDDIPVKVLSVSRWQVNDVHAERISEGRVFCMGDAIHRHPPAAALGSNTCLQDAHNLAWKLAAVLKGAAHPSLLDSYNAERQPVAKQIVERANKSMFSSMQLCDMLGAGIFTKYTEDEQKAFFTTPEGLARLNQALDNESKYTGHAHGVEMTRRYTSGAVVSDGTAPPAGRGDDDLYYVPSTWPGASLPHAWLGKRAHGPLVSTLDVTGKGRFTLLTGQGGESWRAAAAKVTAKRGIQIDVVTIGAYQDYEDTYRDWYRQCEVDSTGCILVRPDQIIAWRSKTLPQEPSAALETVMDQILGWA